MHIRTETPARRCEICHQADRFDPQTNTCQRCSGMDYLTVAPHDQVFHSDPLHSKHSLTDEPVWLFSVFFNPEHALTFGFVASLVGFLLGLGVLLGLAFFLPHAIANGISIFLLLILVGLTFLAPFTIAHYRGHRWDSGYEILFCLIGSTCAWMLIFLMMCPR